MIYIFLFFFHYKNFVKKDKFFMIKNKVLKEKFFGKWINHKSTLFKFNIFLFLYDLNKGSDSKNKCEIYMNKIDYSDKCIFFKNSRNHKKKMK